MRTLHLRRLLSSALGLIVLGCLWFYLAPVGLGGSATYVVTHGVSMEPRFHTGDLAIVRSQSHYHVGEIVAYDSRMFHTVVLHRIVGRDGGRYLFEGDNNNFVDFEHPAANQLIGALWVHIPGAGARIESLHSPALVGGLVAAGMLLFLGGMFTRHRRRRRRAGANASTERPQRHLPQRPADPVLGVLVFGLLALLPFIALALLAFTRPSATRSPVKIPYKQSGSLSYSANAPPGPAYPGDRAVTGEPLFTHVLSTVDLRYKYLFHTAAKHSLTGKAPLSATIVSTSGWHTTFPIGTPTYFRGDHALATASLDLTSLVALIHSVQSTTRVSGTYTMTIAAHVSAAGSLDLVPLSTTFSPKIEFSLAELEIQPLLSKNSAPTTQAPAANPFASSKAGAVAGRRSQPLSLSLGIARLSVTSARTIALAAIVVLLCALLAILAFVRPLLTLVHPRRRDESTTIHSRYGRLIVPVERVRQLPGVAVIDVADMDALARIATHYDRSILHEARDQGDAFWVTDESGHFRFALGAPSATAQDAAVAPAPAAAAAGETTAELGWALPDVPVAVMPEIQIHRDAVFADADPDRTQARAAFARMTGLEWASHS